MTMTRPHALVAAVLALSFLFVSCASEDYSRRADRVARKILDEHEESELGDRYESVARPAAVSEAPGPSPEATPGQDLEGVDDEEGLNPDAPELERRVLNLTEALELAVRGNRSHKARREDLYLQGLSLSSVRHSFAPQLSLTMNYLFSDDDDLAATQSAGVSAGYTQVLPWGGSVSADLGSGYFESNADGQFSTSAGILLSQPLLRGFGAAVSHESLIQAERDLLYAIRSFELAREDFSIEVARNYYDLVQRKQTIENLERNLDGLVFGRRQAEALFRVGRTSELDVLRARRSELGARDNLISEQEDNLVALDRFRIFLGLPKEVPVDVLQTAPEYVPVDFGLAEAIEVALINRLDLITRKQQLEDVERGLEISEDRLRPDLTFTTGIGASSSEDPSFTQQPFGRDAFTAGLNFEVPVDRVDERNAYRSAQIGASRARRSFEEFIDVLVIEIANSFRELERRRQSLDIQSELIAGQEKNVKIAQLRFEQGKIDNRDVTEAKEALLEAQNRLINERVNYEISRLGLLRDLGILFIDEKGVFKE